MGETQAAFDKESQISKLLADHSFTKDEEAELDKLCAPVFPDAPSATPQMTVEAVAPTEAAAAPNKPQTSLEHTMHLSLKPAAPATAS